MAEQTWTRLELPILERVAEVERSGNFDTDLGFADLAERLGVSQREAELGLAALADARYIQAPVNDSSFGGERIIMVRGLTEKGRRAVGQWPSTDPFVNLVQLLDAQIEQTADPETKSRLQNFRDSALGVGKVVLTGVLTEYAKRQAGL